MSLRTLANSFRVLQSSISDWLRQSCQHPAYFWVVLLAGCIGSGGLGFFGRIHPLWSLVPSLGALFALAIPKRLHLKARRDWSTLEDFADDIYMAGYLMTLAALVGLVFRLDNSDGKNLLPAAGLKLLSTIAGLMLRAWFRETASQWREEAAIANEDEFVKRNRQFEEAAKNLNQAAGNLTGRLQSVVDQFDMKTLLKVAKWSKLSADSLEKASVAFNLVPARVANCTQGLDRATEATHRVAKALGGEAIPAVKNLATELTTAGIAADRLTVAGAIAAMAVDSMTTAGIGAAGTMNSMSRQAADNEKVLLRVGQAVGQEVKDRARMNEALRTSERSLTGFTSGLGKMTKATDRVAETLGGEAIPAMKNLAAEINAAGTAAERLADAGESAAGVVDSLAVAGTGAGEVMSSLSKQAADNEKALRRVGQAVGQEVRDRARIDEALRTNEQTLTGLTSRVDKALRNGEQSIASLTKATGQIVNSLDKAAIPAVNKLAEGLNEAGTAGRRAAKAAGSMAADGDAAAKAMASMNKKASASETALAKVSDSFDARSAQLTKVGDTLGKIITEHEQNPTLPMNQLINALNAVSSSAASAAAEREAMETQAQKALKDQEHFIKQVREEGAKQLKEQQELIKQVQAVLGAMPEALRKTSEEVSTLVKSGQSQKDEVTRLTNSLDRLCKALESARPSGPDASGSPPPADKNPVN